MAKKHFVVERYQVTLGDSHSAEWAGVEVKARGIVACFGPDPSELGKPRRGRKGRKKETAGEGLRLLFYFLTEDSPVPPACCVQNARLAAVFLPFEHMPSYVDILRNEKPIYATIDTEEPAESYISTLSEPVGEGE